MVHLDTLNSEQTKAVLHVEGPMLVLAGAGSGKTRIVTHRILHLLEIGVPAAEILAVTFTNKAAEEMKHRVHKLAHVHVLTCTFHSLCARILRESITALGYTQNFIILDEDDSEKALKECLMALSIKEEKSFLKNLRSQISSAKNQLLSPADLSQDNSVFNEIYRLYQTKLKSYNALDFDDLLFLTVRLLREHPDLLELYQKRWSFILIDEYQDTNEAQYMLTKLLSDKHKNVFAVGDPDQSIYSWRGANVQNILHFERDYPGAVVVRLEQNYRSFNTILEAANGLIENNENRYEKNLWSQRGPGEKVHLFIAENEKQEAEFVIQQIKKYRSAHSLPLKECAIFYRTNFQSRTFEDVLLREKIPYTIIGGLSFYQRKEIKDILSLLRMILSGSDFLAFSRTVNLPKRGLGQAALEKIREAAFAQGRELFDVCMEAAYKKIDVKLSPKQLEGLKEYVDCISALREMNKAKCRLDEMIQGALERSRYLECLKEDPETYEERKENIEELIAKASEWQAEAHFPDLSVFLEELTLKSSSEDSSQGDDSVRLMTLHNGKGLEFSLVFLVGMEEDLFPHVNVKESEGNLEEERRLCYVGMTRAKDFLFLTASRYRFLWGAPRTMRPSRFLKEIPSEYVTILSSSSLYAQETTHFEEPSASFQPGDTVFHKDFGTGIVHKAYQTSLGLTYDVFFPKANSTRSLAAKYAKLLPAKAPF
jgi:DNA helicase II / ATP-dependent DNA helicase PcrA